MTKDELNAVKDACSQWGFYMNGGKAPKELKFKPQGYTKLIGSSGGSLVMHDSEIELIGKSIGRLYVVNENAYNVLNRVYFHRKTVSEVIGYYGISKSAFYRRINSAYEFIHIDYFGGSQTFIDEHKSKPFLKFKKGDGCSVTRGKITVVKAGDLDRECAAKEAKIYQSRNKKPLIVLTNEGTLSLLGTDSIQSDI